MTQGDLPVSDYCKRMKILADSLRDVGHAVADSQLILNLLRGLNSRYTNTADDIANVASEFFTPEKQTVLSLGPAPIA